MTRLGLALEVLRGLLQVPIALLVRPTGSETDTDKGRPRAALKEEDGEDDAESEAEGRLDEEVREASVPLWIKAQASLAKTIPLNSN